MSAAINIPKLQACSDSGAKGCLNAVVSSWYCGCCGLHPDGRPMWCHFRCVAMFDILPLLFGIFVPQCLHTVTVLSANLLPSSLYFTGKPKCSHTCNLNDAGGFSSSSAPPLVIDVDWLTCSVHLNTTAVCNSLLKKQYRQNNVFHFAIVKNVRITRKLKKFAINLWARCMPNQASWSTWITDQLRSGAPL